MTTPGLIRFSENAFALPVLNKIKVFFDGSFKEITDKSHAMYTTGVGWLKQVSTLFSNSWQWLAWGVTRFRARGNIEAEILGMREAVWAVSNRHGVVV